MQERAKQTPDDEWREVHLGDVIELKRGYDMPKRERISGSIPLVSSSGVTDYHVEAKVRGPGVITGRYGTLGKVFFVSEDFWPLNTTLYVRDFKGNDPRFIAYFLRGLDFSAYQDKAAVPGLNRNHLHEASVRVPPLPEQRAIAHVLGTLDDKIELNRRMNETLEDMARALFRSWFVDFDPVCAKAAIKQHSRGNHSPLAGEPSGEGAGPAGEWTIERARAYLAGMDPQLVDLFPDRLVDSELGEIPEAWEVKALAQCARLNPESWSLATAPEEVEYVDLANTKWGIIESTQHFSWKEAPSRAMRILRKGDTIVGTVRPGNGSYSFIGDDGLTGSTGFAVLRPTHARYRELVYLAATNAENIGYLARRADGAAYPAVRPAVVAETQVVMPASGNTALDCFSMIVEPILNRLESNKTDNHALQTQRDALLPQLVSGQVKAGETV